MSSSSPSVGTGVGTGSIQTPVGQTFGRIGNVNSGLLILGSWRIGGFGSKEGNAIGITVVVAVLDAVGGGGSPLVKFQLPGGPFVISGQGGRVSVRVSPSMTVVIGGKSALW